MSREYKVNCVVKEKDNVITIDFVITANNMKENEEVIDFLFNFARRFKQA